ncbi:Zinc finger BED domain-containing protein RICESLEEPER 2 [Linum grandiflorum]
MRCVAHITNLVVSDGLNEIILSVKRDREAVKWITGSPYRIEIWKRATNSMNIQCKKSLTLDVPKRWNSTYLMLESVEPFEAAFPVYAGMCSAFEIDLNKLVHRDFIIGTLGAEDWENVRWMMEYLKKFYDLTCLMSGTSYVTSHLFFKEMCDIFDHIANVEKHSDPKIRLMAKKMRSKVAKYWEEEAMDNYRMNKIIYIAVVLDSRQKLKHVHKCLKKVYGVERAASIVAELKELFTELFEFYKSLLLPPRPRMINNSQDSSTQSRRQASVNVDMRRLSNCGSCSAIEDSDDEGDDNDASELTLYLTESQFKEKHQQEDNGSVVDSFVNTWSTISCFG